MFTGELNNSFILFFWCPPLLNPWV